MSADADQEQLTHRSDLLDKELEKFMANAFNSPEPKERIWTETMR
jgi:hypothetical protein